MNFPLITLRRVKKTHSLAQPMGDQSRQNKASLFLWKPNACQPSTLYNKFQFYSKINIHWIVKNSMQSLQYKEQLLYRQFLTVVLYYTKYFELPLFTQVYSKLYSECSKVMCNRLSIGPTIGTMPTKVACRKRKNMSLCLWFKFWGVILFIRWRNQKWKKC